MLMLKDLNYYMLIQKHLNYFNVDSALNTFFNSFYLKIITFDFF